MRSIFPTLTRYKILTLRICNEAPIETNMKFSLVSVSDFDDIEVVRAGYSAQAGNYLREGHEGIVIREGPVVVAMGWYVVNTSLKQMRVKGYYPLRPSRALLHADWVHPEHRGKRLQRALIAARLAILQARHPHTSIETNVTFQNIASQRNFQQIGFEPSDLLTVVNWGPISFSRRHS